ncbi:hypothetical protein HHE02_07210 [Helicobacter heilmannii]|uniref:Uncharacterized protein n=1 Tax=Helicobacter heilmannii TaxID=35817 RepID=A0A0K2Y7I6_HELHE|nr:hypothetical protein BN341_3190 [Helicobacter heilmannii ASB1.4]CRF45820.1 hypothetical protein HHE014_07970 [Helicobacter heilmannii]CRF47432.1 hypothetical protein HHE02_07210 [Helicobacter heilmannii]CRF48992.1 hypothetical protein HHE03_05880 [Helicobacter heilmannii]CRF51161.1 hypothetical protein HHE06_10220 [Helicobacter heilmannii]
MIFSKDTDLVRAFEVSKAQWLTGALLGHLEGGKTFPSALL